MKIFVLNLRNEFHSFLKKNDLFKYWFLIRNIFLITAKYCNVVLMAVVFFINPSKLYKLSWRGSLPSPKNRDKYNDNLIDLLQPKISKNFEYLNKNTKIFCRGFIDKVKFQKDDVLVNFEITSLTKNATFATADSRILDHYVKNKVDVIYIKVILIDNNNSERVSNPIKKYENLKIITLTIHTNNPSNRITTGSGILSILSFYLLSQNTTIYGWNHYQNKKLSSMNLFEFILKIFFYSRDFITKDCVEYSLTHLFFAYHFKDLENLKIYGNIDYFENKLFDKFITKRLIKIFCN